MKVPSYQNQVSPGRINAAEPRTGAPVSEAFGADGARAAVNLGQGAERLAAGIAASAERSLTRQKNLRMTAAQLNWRKDNDELLNGRIDPDTGERIEGGLLTKTYGDAKDIAKTYRQKGRELMQKYLDSAQSPEEREELALAFEQDFQNNFDTVARYQYKQERATDDLLTKTYGEQQAGLAGGITTVADMRRNLDETYAVFNKNAQANGLSEEVQRMQRYGVANTNVSSSIKGALSNGNILAAREVLDGVKDDLLPADWNALNFLVSKAQEAQENAKTGTNVDADEILYQRAIVQMSQDPAAFQQEVKAAGNNLYAFQQKFMQDTGLVLPAKDLKTYLDWAQKVLDDPNGTIGQQKAVNFAAAKTEYDSFEIGKAEENYPVGNKEFDSPAALADAAGRLRMQILSGSFTDSDAKTAQKQLNNYRRALGSKIKTSAPNTWFGQTGDEFLQKSIHKFISAPGTEDFPLEDIAGIYEEAVRLAGKEQLDLTADYDEHQKAFNQLVDQAKKNFVAAKYGVPVETVEMALVNGRVLALQNYDKPTKADFAKAMESYIAGYKRSQNGANVKTQNGKILNMYFDED